MNELIGNNAEIEMELLRKLPHGVVSDFPEKEEFLALMMEKLGK